MLSLPEELLLLSLDDHGHTHGAPTSNLELGLLAAAICELQFRGRIEVEEVVRVRDASPTGDRALDEVLELLSAMRDDVKTLEMVLTGMVNQLGWLRERVLGGLVGKNIVHDEAGKVLWLIPQHKYSVEHGEEELSLIGRVLRTLVLGQQPDRRTSMLLAILAACFTSDQHLRDRMFAEMRDRMYEVVNSGGELQGHVRDAIGGALASTQPMIAPTLFSMGP